MAPVQVIGEEKNFLAQALFLAYQPVKKLDMSRLAVYWRPQFMQVSSRRSLMPGPPLFSFLSISARSLSVRSLKIAVPKASIFGVGISPKDFRQRAIRAFLP